MKITLVTLLVVIVTLSITTMVCVISIKKLGREDADQMLHLTTATGAMHLESYFESVEHSVETVSMLVQDNFKGVPYENLELQVEQARNFFERIAHNTNGVFTYYFRIDPEISENVKGFWYVYQEGKGFVEHKVTDLSNYDTNDTSSIIWFTIPKANGKGIWLPPYYTENLNMQVISYNVPVYWKNRFVGVIGIEIDYKTLAHEAEDIQIFKSGYAFILDENQNVIYHPELGSVQLNLETKAIKKPERFIGSNHIEYRFQGVKKEAVYILLSNGMRLYVTAPKSEIDSRWKGMICNISIVSLMIMVFSAIVMFRFTGCLTKPLHDLTEAAKQVGNGNYEFSLEYNKEDEVGILTSTFKQLVCHTKEHISNLHQQAYIDEMTSVGNKAAYGAYIQKLQDQMDHPEGVLTFAIGVFDCDNLKYINDTYGHDKGDVYLTNASKLICRIFKHSPVFRIGGDEFAVILQGDDLNAREELLAEFRKIRAEICQAAENDWEQVNVTLGIAVYDSENDPAVIDVARRADQQMYENKRIRKENRRKMS
jgi:diguanylate cyclase (GGDEF)-like protein